MMCNRPASIVSWLAEPLSKPITRSVAALQHLPGVGHVALMPDVHLANEVCIGTVIATNATIYPAAVGSDIGCGMATIAFDVTADVFRSEEVAAKLLVGLRRCVPPSKHRSAIELPSQLDVGQLSHDSLRRKAARDGRFQLGSLGRGNHFCEFQEDRNGRLWVMIHSGSRAMGQHITAFHSRSVDAMPGAHLGGFQVDCGQGQDYLNDVQWARKYASENRLTMLHAVAKLMDKMFSASADWSSLIHTDHNHVQRELHFGEEWWVHRKGAQRARSDEAGVIPGSMGTASFHVQGRGCAKSLHSCSHGAGRRMSRSVAREHVDGRRLKREMGNVRYDNHRSRSLCDEAPSAYKDVRTVMRAQRELVRTTNELQPVLSYKS